ncbi:hypothetical protein [Chryseobacterium shigense]|uniref:Uncharacterized protein n=1 Tax=Chryseobacterium shigense TaxID=297244 RepID=A0A841N7F3_9FLAO|nr:hypothetical protein [Chryseobacterium shigense]MBB6369390.1 hypothetical protein [Chryseobacterium shigense]
MRNIIIVSLFLAVSCQDNTKKDADINAVEENIAVNSSTEAEKAKKWLEKSIVSYFKADISDQEKRMQDITTKDYYEYKTDAANVDMDVDGSLTLKEFQDKWKNKFNTKYAGINTGFLISEQDWINIGVGKCELDAISGNNAFVFDVEITDEGAKAIFDRKIGVVKKDDKFLIADVLEKD